MIGTTELLFVACLWGIVTLEDHSPRSNRNTGVGYLWRPSDLSRNKLRWTFS